MTAFLVKLRGEKTSVDSKAQALVYGQVGSEDHEQKPADKTTINEVEGLDAAVEATKQRRDTVKLDDE